MMRDLHPELHTYTMDTIPSSYAHQIRSFIRMEWWDGYKHSLNPALGDPAFQPQHFVVVEGDALYSAARVNRTTIQHQGQDYVVYGLGGVLTYPAFRKKGFGSWVVREATQYIHQQADADIAVLWTATHNLPFYERLGWELMPDVQFIIGDREQPDVPDGHVLMLFLSEMARANRENLEDKPIYFGEHSW